MTNMVFKTIAMDPPWLERGGGKSKRGADRHYQLMSVVDIYAALCRAADFASQASTGKNLFDPRPETDHVVATDAHLWMWCTDNFLQDGLWLMGELGFRYVRTMAWVKIAQKDMWTPDADSHYIARETLQIGLGQYLRGAHELCLLGVRGGAMVPEPANRLPSVVFAERTRHSAKPQEAYDVIGRVSPGPRLEMFARTPRTGWEVWGNEVAA